MTARIILILFSITSFVNAQEVIYFTKADKKTDLKDSAYYYRKIIKHADNDYDVSDYYLNDVKKMDGHFVYIEPFWPEGKFTFFSEDGKVAAIRFFHSKEDGISTYFYPNGNKSAVINYKEGKKHGLETIFYENGKIKIERNYKNDIEADTLKSYYPSGELKRLQFFDQKGQVKGGKVFTRLGRDTVFYSYLEKPAFNGTQKEMDNYWYRHLLYPKQAKHDGFRGKVIVICKVTKDGSATEIKTLYTSHDFLVETAVNFIKNMPTWRPGRIDGVPADSEMTISIPFSFR